MNSKTVIRVEHVSKQYRLGVINHGTLYRDLQSWWARLRRLPDPNAVISDISANLVDRRQIKGDVFQALDDVSFNIEEGSVVGIIGSNGAGKSTLLKIISRITAPTSGVVRIKGRVASLLEVGTGFHPELTGRENIYLNGAILGMRKGDIARKFEQIVEFAEIGKFIDTPVKRYSSGMYVRLAFSVAAHLEPEILLIDEVLAVGDANFQKKCMGRMQEIGREGRTILFVSHNMTAISSICSKAIYMREGRVDDFAETGKVIQKYLVTSQSGANGTYQTNPSLLEGKAVIYRLAVLDAAGRGGGIVELTEDFQIEVSYELREALRGLSVGLQIIAEDGYTCIYSLSDPELDPSRLDTRQPGTYRAVVRFPRCSLNTGTYYLRAGISSMFSIFSVVDNLRFEVIDSVGIIQMLGQSRKPSISALQLPWDVQRIS